MKFTLIPCMIRGPQLLSHTSLAFNCNVLCLRVRVPPEASVQHCSFDEKSKAYTPRPARELQDRLNIQGLQQSGKLPPIMRTFMVLESKSYSNLLRRLFKHPNHATLPVPSQAAGIKRTLLSTESTRVLAACYSPLPHVIHPSNSADGTSDKAINRSRQN